MQNSRREFLKTAIPLAFSFAAMPALSSEKLEEVSPVEDLMREHGVLDRILLVYEEIIIRLSKGEEVSLRALHKSASIVRSFIEDYHEKLEEDYLFPLFEKTNKLTDLTKILRQQHKVLRKITDKALSSKLNTDNERSQMAKDLRDFVRAYRPHEAWEETVLFPALRKIVSKSEFDFLGEEFENQEHKLFGEDGFERVVVEVSLIEKELEIHDLSRYTKHL